MLNIKNFNNLKGDYIQFDGYTLSIEYIKLDEKSKNRQHRCIR